MNIRPDRRRAFLAGEGRMGEALVGRLTAEFPVAAMIWRSPIWEFLDSDLADRTCESRLYEELGVPRSTMPLVDVLARASEQCSAALGTGLDRVSIPILALRVAKKAQLDAMALQAAADLARSLLFLSGCRYRRAAAEQIWIYAGHSYVRGLRAGSHRVSFMQRTWDFVESHATSVRVTLQDIAYASPLISDLPYPIMEEMLRDVIDSLTSVDPKHAELVMVRFNSMSPHRHSRDAIPDIDALSIWGSSRL
jgi:hypothetical protein